jgi:uncharacterized protein (DUF697 family)
MNVDEATDKIWVKLGQEKYLVWEVRIALLLAAFVSYFTMPFAITFLLAVVWVTVMVTLRKTETASPEEKEAHSS